MTSAGNDSVFFLVAVIEDQVGDDFKSRWNIVRRVTDRFDDFLTAGLQCREQFVLEAGNEDCRDRSLEGMVPGLNSEGTSCVEMLNRNAFLLVLSSFEGEAILTERSVEGISVDSLGRSRAFLARVHDGFQRDP